jgi:L-seryl-tRNA(Ser) seleniumtransferase
MAKKTGILTLGILMLTALALHALTIDVSGTWEITTQSPRGGERTSEMTIEQDGEAIKVTMEGFRGNEMQGEGTVTDNKIAWSVNISTQRGDFSISYTGTVDGNTMSGQAEMGDFGAMDWTAKKK